MSEALALAGGERILITGAGGWLGRSLLSVLLPSAPADRLDEGWLPKLQATANEISAARRPSWVS